MALITSFPHALNDSLSLRGLPLTQLYPGKVFWVGNSASLLEGETTASNSNVGSFLQPFSTIDYAIGQCVAGRGDVIYVRPGHTVTATAAGSITLDISGVAIIGLGTGALRPTVTFDTATTASFLVSGANCTVSNFLFLGGINALVNPIHVQAADFTMLNCEYRDTSTFETVDAVVTTAAATRFTVDGFKYVGSTSAGADTCFSIVGAVGFQLRNFDIVGLFAVAAIEFVTTVSTDVRIRDGLISNLDTTDPILIGGGDIANTTGVFGPNLFCNLGDADNGDIAAAFPTSAVTYVNPIMITTEANATGLAVVKTASTDA